MQGGVVNNVDNVPQIIFQGYNIICSPSVKYGYTVEAFYFAREKFGAVLTVNYCVNKKNIKSNSDDIKQRNE